ncbi:MAG: BON domain-containing protein [Terriglobales bacterium]|jgi:hypothetical protein
MRNAHNVKIITQHGQVTLKGPVRSEDEKQSVEAKAAGIGGKQCDQRIGHPGNEVNCRRRTPVSYARQSKENLHV